MSELETKVLIVTALAGVTDPAAYKRTVREAVAAKRDRRMRFLL